MSAPAPRRSARLAQKRQAREATLFVSQMESESPSSAPPLTCKGVNRLLAVSRIVTKQLEDIDPLEKWNAVSEEQYINSLLYLRELLNSNEYTPDGEPNHEHIVTIFSHIAEQPIVMASSPLFRKKLVKKVNRILNHLSRKRDLNLMAFYAPIFNEFMKTVNPIHLHPFYKE